MALQHTPSDIPRGAEQSSTRFHRRRLYFANADRKFLKSPCSRSCPILWRPRRESNPRTRICSPLRSHSATRPLERASYRRGEAGASARTQQVAALAFLSATSRGTSLAARFASLCNAKLPAANAVPGPPRVEASKGTFDALFEKNPGMAGRASQRHLDRLGRDLGRRAEPVLLAAVLSGRIIPVLSS